MMTNNLFDPLNSSFTAHSCDPCHTIDCVQKKMN